MPLFLKYPAGKCVHGIVVALGDMHDQEDRHDAHVYQPEWRQFDVIFWYLLVCLAIDRRLPCPALPWPALTCPALTTATYVRVVHKYLLIKGNAKVVVGIRTYDYQQYYFKHDSTLKGIINNYSEKLACVIVGFKLLTSNLRT